MYKKILVALENSRADDTLVPPNLSTTHSRAFVSIDEGQGT